MKKILLTLSAVLVLVLSGCGGSGNPKAVADKFANDFLTKFEPEKLAKHATDKFAEEIRTNMVPDTEDGKIWMAAIRTGLQEMKFKYSYNEEESDIREDYATIVYDVTSGIEPDFEEEMEIELVNEDGKWKVSDFNFNLF